MRKRQVHTPEGVRDIYGLEYAKKLKMQDFLQKKFESFGYRDIQTPTFEFFDAFSNEIGTTKSNELYKFFDKEGNTLVLRPDFTPSVARCAAKYFMNENIPVRFSYAGNTFTNTSNLQGKLKEVTQMGVELIGDASVEADAELIYLAIEALRSTGLQEFQISVGEIDFFKGICKEAGLDEETETELRECISNKNMFAAEELLERRNISKEQQQVFLKINELFGSFDGLHEAKELVKNSCSLQAIERLSKVYEILCLYGVQKYVSFDLGMVSKYHYYTGVIFKAYTYGVGDAVVKGGRYDNLLSYFGKEAPAMGFMIVVDNLLEAFAGQKIDLGEFANIHLLIYKKETFTEVLALAVKMRAYGLVAEMIPYDETISRDTYEKYAAGNLVKELHYLYDAEAVAKLSEKYE